MFVTDDESLGAYLRRERERRQISLESIADRTKIGIGLLKGLERDDLSRWPSGIFRRSFIRAYANATGLDAEAIILEFQQRFPDPEDALIRALRAQPDVRDEERSGQTAHAGQLRLSLAEDAQPYFYELREHLLQRCQAVVWDLAVLAIISAILVTVGSAFWMSLAVATVCYYVVAVFFFGNTAGAALSIRTRHRSPAAPAPHAADVTLDPSGSIVVSPPPQSVI